MTIKFSDITGGGIPYGNNSGRPANPGIGKLYSNGESARLELFTQASGWQNIIQETPGVSSITGAYNESIGSGVITISGTNFVTGCSATAIGTNGIGVEASTTVFNSLVQLTATFSGLSPSYEPYDIKVTNPSNLFGMLPDALYINNTPSWQTPAGNLGTFIEMSDVSIMLSATDPDSEITYSSSNLPSWLSLNSSTGYLTGTAPSLASDTTYQFNVTASDGINSTSRSFNIIIPNSLSSVEILLVAGGGAGGAGTGGGGGAGGLIYADNYKLGFGTYTLSVGAGGTNDTNDIGSSGSNTTLSGVSRTLVALGGGYGGASESGDLTWAPSSGGSGGGAQNYYAGNNTGGLKTQASTTNDGVFLYTLSGFGNNGESFATGGSGAGGGGAGSAGSGPNGGQGKQLSITGTSQWYAAGGSGGNQGTTSTNGIGGYHVGPSGTNGAVNTGSGGGGGYSHADGDGGDGGSGVIIIAYPDTLPVLTIGSGLTYSQPTRAGYRVYRFTAGTGTITF